MPAKSFLAAPPEAHKKSQAGLLGRHGQQQQPRRSKGLDYVMLSGAISIAVALAVLLATSHRMVHLGSQGGSRVRVRLKTLDHTDPDLVAAEALASGKPEDIGSYFTVDRSSEGERLMRLAYPQYAARLDNAKEPKTASQLPEEGGAESLQKQDSSNAQQDRSTADADKEQSDMDSQQESKSGAQQSEEKGVATPQQDGEGSRMAGQLADTDVSSDRQEQKEGGDSGGRGAGIWVIDLTVDDPEALQDGEDTYMVKMWRELEEQRKKEELDPAKQAGAAILELEGADAGVQRLRALGAQVRAKLGLPSASGDAAQEGPLEQAGEAGGSMSGDSAADTASLTSGDVEATTTTPLRLVTLFRDREPYKEPENPKMTTWKEDLDRRLLELEEAAAVRRKALEQERAHLFPHIPLVEGILEKAVEPGAVVKGLYRPAAVEDLLDGAELEQRLSDEGRLEGILRDPELMPNWEVQLQMQQAG